MPGYEEKGGQPPNLEALIKKVLLDEESRKQQQEQINKIESNVRVIGKLICDENGNCRLASKEEVRSLAPKSKGDLSGYTNKELYTQLIKSKTAQEDLEKAYGLEKLKEDPASMLRAAQDPEFRKAFIETVCSDEQCRVGLNREIDELHKSGKIKTEKKHFLVKEK